MVISCGRFFHWHQQNVAVKKKGTKGIVIYMMYPTGFECRSPGQRAYGKGKIEEKCLQSKFTNFTHVISNLFGFGKLMKFSQL